MSHKLPDETISEILSPALMVPDHLFADTSPESPFASFSQSCSSLLLVCKSWLRVATPLLYHVVIIRSTAQARALQSTLQNNSDLGKFVKKLRVEGGYKNSMHQVLQKTPNITDILISLIIHSSDSTAGLVLGLPLINPTRLIILDETDVFLKNENVKKLIKALETCVPKWANLKTIIFPYDHKMTARESFCKSLCSSPTVKILTFPEYARSLEPFLVDCARVSSLKAIEIRPKSPNDPQAPPTSKDPRLGKLLRWANASALKPTARPFEAIVCLPRDSAFRPMISASQSTIDLVWSRILFFTMLSLEQHPENIPAWNLPERNINFKRLQFLLVSKHFFNLGLPYLYRFPVFNDTDILISFSSSIIARHELGAHVRVLDFRFKYPCGLVSRFGVRTSTDSASEPLAAILPHTCHLTHLIGGRSLRSELESAIGGELDAVSWATFKTLSEVAGRTLQECTGLSLQSNSDTDSHSPTIFRRFTALRSFTWRYCRRNASEATETLLFEAVDQITAAALPNLQNLEVRTSNGLVVFSQMNLPSLRHATFEIYGDWDAKVFLRAHGTNLEYLEIRRDTFAKHSAFTLCPNMTTLVFHVNKDDGFDLGLELLGDGFVHISLTKMIVHKFYVGSPNKEEQDWDEFFKVLDVSYFPALREVCVPSTCVWPTKEWDIGNSVWVKWAEIFLARGIKLTDKSGTGWRPRLKLKASRS
ncbi:hypothetical protein B0H11DRAFT_1392905 [Mycena galericulata]|nr:hypothetical protein B0H11DRAFT_1392905 [Mycena galericulata]